MKYGRLTKLSKNENALRTSETEGEFLDLPETGFDFRLVGESLNKSVGNKRLIQTSKLMKVIKSRDILSGNDIYHFTTLNSDYMLEVYG